MKTLDEAIAHCEEKAKAKRREAEIYIYPHSKYCEECAEEHEQLARWLQNYDDISKAVKRWQNRELSAIETLKMIIPFIEQQTRGANND